MPNSQNEDQDQRKNTSMEDSTAMTIEVLWERLLSEKSVSRTARQRADELAKRVVELEEQLKIVILQRKKAEKATTNVLAILKNHGMSDVTEEFESSSYQGPTLSGTMVGNNSVEVDETSDNHKVRKHDMEVLSGSEHESSPLTGRSLSWKSGKDSQHSLEKKKYIDPTRRRRSSFASTGSSSPKRDGKPCRRTRRRESRSPIEELKNDTILLGSDGVATYSEPFPSSSNVGPETSMEGSKNHEERDLLEDHVLGVFENQRVNSGRYFNGCGGDKDMESALEHQAQLIGRYKAEEKAQKEWEVKFSENKSCTLDSCDAGNHSDITEERDEIKALVPPCSAGMITSENQEAKLDCEERKTPNGFRPPANVESGKDQKCSSVIAHESPASEFSFPMAQVEHDQNDSCDAGNHSDITEERDETKAPVPQCSAGMITSENQEAKLDSEECKTPNGFRPPANVESGRDQKCSNVIANESPASEFAFPMAQVGHDQNCSENCCCSLLHLHDAPWNHPAQISSSCMSSGSCKEEASGSRNKLALISHGSPDNLGSILEALRQAKLSLKQKLDRLPLLEGGSVGKSNEPFVPAMRTEDRLEIPVGSAGLFRLPTNFQFESTTRANFMSSGSRLGLENYPSQTAGDRFFSSPNMDLRSKASAGGQFLTIAASPYTEIRSGIPTRMAVLEPSLDAVLPSSRRYIYPDFHSSTSLQSSSKYTYPFYPDVMPRIPSNEGFSRPPLNREGFSRPLPNREGGISPATFSFYDDDDHIRGNMYR